MLYIYHRSAVCVDTRIEQIMLNINIMKNTNFPGKCHHKQTTTEQPNWQRCRLSRNFEGISRTSVSMWKCIVRNLKPWLCANKFTWIKCVYVGPSKGNNNLHINKILVTSRRPLYTYHVCVGAEWATNVVLMII